MRLPVSELSAVVVQCDAICRSPMSMLQPSNNGGCHVLKNILAAVGIVVIAKKGYEVYRQYKSMEAECEVLRKGQRGA